MKQIQGHRILLSIVALALAVFPGIALNAADTIYIGPGGKDNAPGTEKAPRLSIQKALNEAEPGDTVRLLPGVYRQRVIITKGGEYAAPITLEGMGGAVMEGHENFAPKWSEATDIAPGVYRTPLAFLPRAVMVDGKQLVLMDEKRFAPLKKNDNPRPWETLFRKGFERGGWKCIQGAGLYLKAKKEFLVRFDGDKDPRTMKFAFSPDVAVVRIDGANRVVLRNLELRNAHHGVFITDSIGSVVENCYVNHTRDGITLSKGADRCTLRYNKITQNALGVNNGFNKIVDGKTVRDDKWSDAWDLWVAHKIYGYYDSRAINMDRSVGGHRVHDNHIFDHWDGIATRDWDDMKTPAAQRVQMAGYNRGTEVHHNRIERMNDDALELNDGGVDERWHHNIISNARCGLRLKPIDKGPLYIYGNIWDNNGEDIRFFGDVELNPAVVYIYQNTSNATQAVMSNKIKSIGTPEFHVYNNLFWVEKWWGNTAESILPNWKGDDNVLVRRGDSPRWRECYEMACRLRIDEHSHWLAQSESPFVGALAHDFRITEKSPARGACRPLKETLGLDLPGTGEFGNAAAPDAGALPYGAPMLELPRKPEDVKEEPAGMWPARS